MRRVDKKVNSKTQNLRHARNPQQSDEFFFFNETSTTTMDKCQQHTRKIPDNKFKYHLIFFSLFLVYLFLRAVNSCVCCMAFFLDCVFFGCLCFLVQIIIFNIECNI